ALFYDGPTNTSRGPLTTPGGVTTAPFSTAMLAVGTHNFGASYSGDGNFTNSGGTLTGGQVVNKAGTSTAVASSVSPAVFGQSVTLTATVTVNSPGTTAAPNPHAS